MNLTRPVALAGLALGLAAAVPAQAQERAASPAPAPVPGGAFATPAVDDASLGRETGREDIGAMVARATQRNTVAGNSVVGNSTTGAVQIDGNAFQNLQGMAVISANSGNNVAMSAAMNVTISMGTR